MINDYLLLIVQFVGLNTTPYSNVWWRRMDLTHRSKWTNSHFPQEVTQATIGTLLLSRPPEFFHKSFPDALNCRHRAKKGSTTSCLGKAKRLTANCFAVACYHSTSKPDLTSGQWRYLWNWISSANQTVIQLTPRCYATSWFITDYLTTSKPVQSISQAHNLFLINSGTQTLSQQW